MGIWEVLWWLNSLIFVKNFEILGGKNTTRLSKKVKLGVMGGYWDKKHIKKIFFRMRAIRLPNHITKEGINTSLIGSFKVDEKVENVT